ncbi:MAG: hypothetical protein RSB76_01495, partial [Clostridia bacterium]
MKYARVIIDYPDVYLEKDSKLGRIGTHIGVIDGVTQKHNSDSILSITTDIGNCIILEDAGILDGKYVKICQKEICDCCSGNHRGCRNLIEDG